LRSDCSTQRSRGENSIFPRASFSTSSRSSISRVRCPTCRWMIWSSRLFTSPAWRGCSGRVSPELAGFAARGLASPETRPLGPRRRLYRAYIAASWIHESQPSIGLWRWRSSECMAGTKPPESLRNSRVPSKKIYLDSKPTPTHGKYPYGHRERPLVCSRELGLSRSKLHPGQVSDRGD
jgi:hypothetical protein